MKNSKAKKLKAKSHFSILNQLKNAYTKVRKKNKKTVITKTENKKLKVLSKPLKSALSTLLVTIIKSKI